MSASYSILDSISHHSFRIEDKCHCFCQASPSSHYPLVSTPGFEMVVALWRSETNGTELYFTASNFPLNDS